MFLLNAFQKGITGALGALLCYLLFLLYRYDKTLIRKYISFFLTSSLRHPKLGDAKTQNIVYQPVVKYVSFE